MIWHVYDNGGEARDTQGRYAIYATPEGFVVMDRRAMPRRFSEPLPTLEEAMRWAEWREHERAAA